MATTMKFKKLGNSDLNVSVVTLGTMVFGEQLDEEASHAMLDRALELGINTIDTAELYPTPSKASTQGSTERIVGTWLDKIGAARRKDLIIVSKVAGYVASSHMPGNRQDPPSAVPMPCRLDRKSIFEAVDASLRRLHTPYLDLYLLHWPDRYVPGFGKDLYDAKDERSDSISFEEQATAMADLVKAGKIRYWGVSNETTFGVCSFVETCRRLQLPLPVAIQNSYSLVHRAFETQLAEACSSLNFNIGLLPWSPLAGGFLTGKYLDDKPADSRFLVHPTYQDRFTKLPMVAATRKYVDIAKKHNLNATELALSFVTNRSFVASAVIGATRSSQLEENVAACLLPVLEQSVLDEIDAVHRSCRDPQTE